MTKCDVVILAAGLSSRANGDKMLYQLAESTVLERVVQVFLPLQFVDKIIITANKNNQGQIEKLCKDCTKPIEIVLGASSRHLSVKAALSKVTAPIVLIHDGARPFVTQDLIKKIHNCTMEYGAAIPTLAVADSLRKITNDSIVGSLEREHYVLVQTPQGFDSAKLKDAFAKAKGANYTDESELYLEQIGAPRIVAGSQDNHKITSLQDLISSNIRVGIGWDLHILEKDTPLVICGVRVPYDKGLVSHTDGDIAFHAVIDALFSAAGLADIGTHFPDSDTGYKGVDSMELVRQAYQKIKNINKKINNLSVLIIADSPKLSPFAEQMKQNLADVLNIKKEQIALHFKTSEGQFPQDTMQAWAVCSML